MLKWLVVAAVIWGAWKLFGGSTRPRRASIAVPEAMPAMRARDLLGVPRGSDERAIREAYRRKVAAAHPDRGGSEEETRKLNAARDLLLGDLG